MSKKELIALDKLLVKLQSHLDNVISPSHGVMISIRRIVDLEIQAIEASKEPTCNCGPNPDVHEDWCATKDYGISRNALRAIRGAK